jgi:hypothetical protein
MNGIQVRVTALESGAGAGGDSKQPVVESVGFVRGGLTSASWSPGRHKFLVRCSVLRLCSLSERVRVPDACVMTVNIRYGDVRAGIGAQWNDPSHDQGLNQLRPAIPSTCFVASLTWLGRGVAGLGRAV